MKILILNSALLILLAACDSPSFQVGECVQKPDSMVVWKVDEVSGNNMVLTQNQNPQMKNRLETKAAESWIKTECL